MNEMDKEKILNKLQTTIKYLQNHIEACVALKNSIEHEYKQLQKDLNLEDDSLKIDIKIANKGGEKL